MITVKNWEPINGLVFEANALKAIKKTDLNIVVSAGPGAGKTELLAQRANFLLQTGESLYPRRILAVSFKVDAAQNLAERVRLRAGATLSSRFDSFTFHAFAKRVVDSFRTLLSPENYLKPDYTLDAEDRVPHHQITFDDLIYLAQEIIDTHPFVKNTLKHTYSHVLLDEFQDCTRAQYRLVSSIFKDTDTVLTAVGDGKQRIMGWAGALDGIMQTFAEDFNAEILLLYQNFRSKPRLRRMQNKMIAEMDPQAVSSSEEVSGETGSIQILSFDSDTDEAEFLADAIQRWLEAGTEPSEIAILVRQQTDAMTQKISALLTVRKISWRNEQLRQDLMSEPVSELILDYFRLIVGEQHPDAYSSFMRTCHTSHHSDDAAAHFDSKLKDLIQKSRQILISYPSRALDRIFWQERLDEFLQNMTQPALVSLSYSYSQGNRLYEVVENFFEAFTNELTLHGEPHTALSSAAGMDFVSLSTIHKSKGLEFEKVIIMGVEREAFWGDYSEVLSTFFVGISRAKNELILTHTRQRSRPEKPVKSWRVRRTPHKELLNFATE